jgi:hypothetical protein
MLSQITWAGPLFNSGNTPNGQAFVSACSGSQAYGGQPNPGDSGMITDADAPYSNCFQAQGASVGTPVLSNPTLGPSLFQSPVPFSNSTGMSANAGSLGFFATDTGSPVGIFPGAWGSGGWNDSFVWNGPTGMWLPQLDVNASVLDTYDNQCVNYSGFTCPTNISNHSPDGEAVLEVDMLSNGGFLQSTAEMNAFAAANPGTNSLHPGNVYFTAKWGDILSTAGFEVAEWKADGTTPAEIANNQIITFAIPVTHGQAVNFGVYVSYLVSGADGGNDGFISTQTIDPMTSFAGPGSIDTGSGPQPVLASYIGPSASGFDYSATTVPEPGTAVLGGLGVALYVASRRRRR